MDDRKKANFPYMQVLKLTTNNEYGATWRRERQQGNSICFKVVLSMILS